MKNLLFLSFVLFFSATSYSQENKSQSLLWEITGNGIEKPSYLYGTMHVSNKLAFHLGDTFFKALEAAEVIALESDPGKWMEEMFTSKSSMSMNGYRKYLDFDSDKNFYETVTSSEYPDKKNLTAALRDKHALQNGFLYRGSNYGNEFEETTYLDLFIYQYGKKNRKTVLNLEDHKTTNILQIKAMLPDKKLSEEEEKKKKKKKKSYYSQWNEEITVREALEDAYRNGQVNIIDSIMKLTAYSDNYMKYFLYERNKIMAEGMDSLLKSTTLFVGIGAAHLAGNEGVIEILRKKGYQLRPVQRTITQFAKDKKNEIEETFIPVPFTKQTTKDGYISLNLPGPLYETPGEGGDIQYFYPEMTNGGYFFIRRYNTFSPLHQLNSDVWSKKIDSLIFENIEGKILHEKSLKINGFNAKDILNKTRKGDYQRRIIVYTPLEVIFFKMSGTGKWVEQYGDEFFNSISFNLKKPESYTYQSYLNDFEINFPTPPIHNIHAEQLHNSNRHVIQSYNPKDSSYFILFSSHINDINYIEEDSFEVKFLIRTFYEQLDSSSIEYIKLESNKSALGKGKYLGKNIYTKAILKRNFYFLLVAEASKENADAYFNSFNYSGEFINQELKMYRDTVLHYSVNTPVYPDEIEDLLFSVRKTRRQEDKNTWDTYETNRYFDNPITQESIQLNYYKFADYYQVKSLDEFWKKEISEYKEDNFIISKQKIDNTSEIPSCHLLLSDTNSSKQIEIKKYLNQGVLYTLKTSYDSIALKSQFISAFFKSFQPLSDTLIGKSVTENSANAFFSDLRSMDSLRIKKAIEQINLVQFEKEHIDSMVWFIYNYKFPEDDKEASKVYLIRELGYVKSPKAIDYLIQLYEESDENHEEQFAVLKGLAKIGTKKSFKALSKLLLETPPIASSSNTVDYLFNYFDDSLQLSKTLYPQLWDLMLYTKYRLPVYELSTTMLDSGLIKASSYKKFKPFILREAKSLSQKKEKYNSRIKLEETGYYYRNGERINYEKLLIDQFSSTKYMKLLIPYYQKDKSVRKFFNKIFQSNNNENRYIAAVLFSQKNLSVPDSVLQILSNSGTYAYPFYRDLALSGKTKRFKPTSFSQNELAKSIVYAGSRRLDPEKDTVTFVKKVAFTEKNNTQYIYFFKSESNYGHKWQLHFAGLMPSDSTKIMEQLDTDFVDREITVYSESELEKEIDKTIKELYLRNRKRAKKQKY